MPHLTERALFAADDLGLCRVVCDGVDAPRPVEERIAGDRLIVVLRGRFTFRDRDTSAVASPSTALCLHDGQGYHIGHVEGGGDVCLTVRGSLVSALREAGPTSRPISPRAYLRLRAIVADLMTGAVPTRLTVEEELCRALAPEVCDQRSALVPSNARRRDATLVDAIVHRIERDVEARLSLRDLAARERVSIFHLCRVFKRTVGTTIHRYHHEIRLRHALSLLLETELPLAQIAVALGFANQGHFTNVFHRRFQTTPGHVRTSRGQALRVDQRSPWV